MKTLRSPATQPRSKNKDNSTAVTVACLLTLAYSDVFEFPLTAAEVWQRLVLTSSTSKLPPVGEISAIEVQQCLQQLVETAILEQHDQYFQITGAKQLAQLRLDRAVLARDKWVDAEAAATVLAAVPWVEAVYVTGSLAVNNTKPEADVDFLLVTSPQRLWLTRIWVTIMAWQLGKRRSWHDEEHRSWCFNLWVERDQLGIFAEPTRRSLYTAYELVQASCLFDRSKVQAELQRHNSWVFEHLNQWPVSKPTRQVPASKQFSWWVEFCLNAVNNLAYWIQRWYMAPHQTSEQVSRFAAFFHPRPTPQLTMKRMRGSLERILTHVRARSTKT